MITSLLVAGAIAFCAERPAEPRCWEAPSEVAQVSNTDVSTLSLIASSSRQGARYRSEGLGDRWGEGNDCEDAVLGMARSIRRQLPHLSNAYRFVLLHRGWEMQGTQRIRITHLVLVVETEDGPLVLDPQRGTIRSWQDYTHLSAFTPAAGMSGQWVPY